ncbi:hypothetical protein ABZP36_010375 [Zizania latifolia]
MSPPADTSGAPLAPLIEAQLNFILSQSKLPIKVGQIWSGCRDGRYAYRFTLAIPCLDYVYWHFLYNALSPKVAPDVVFGPDDEGFQPLVDSDGAGSGKRSCLARWDCRDTGGLLTLVKELRELYIEYQKKLAAEVDDARLKFEISTVMSMEPDEVKFAVPLLDVDFAKLVPGCPWKLPQKIHLQAVFPINRSYSSVPSAPRLKLVSTPDLRCMAVYLPNLEENLKIQVVDASASIGSRRRFIEALSPTFGRPLEADPIFCRRATVLSISGIFTFLVHFIIPLQFPKQQPVLTLQSSQHFNAQGMPIISPPIDDYPWSPRWDPTEMVERIYDFLVDECQNFKRFCSDALPQQK